MILSLAGLSHSMETCQLSVRTWRTWQSTPRVATFELLVMTQPTKEQGMQNSIFSCVKDEFNSLRNIRNEDCSCQPPASSVMKSKEPTVRRCLAVLPTKECHKQMVLNKDARTHDARCNTNRALPSQQARGLRVRARVSESKELVRAHPGVWSLQLESWVGLGVS